MSKIRTTFYLILLAFVFTTPTLAAYRAPVWSKDGMAATPHAAATDAAVEILRAGGNAVDAAVAAAFALSVVEQYHSGLGGGEFALLYLTGNGRTIAVDARECAPQAATADMFIDSETGKPYEKKSYRGGWAVGVPGSVAGRVQLIEKYGRLSPGQVIEPALRLARDGFLVDRVLAARIESFQDNFAEDKTTRGIFFRDGAPLKRGELLKQPQLARTLAAISKDKGRSFYHGLFAGYIVSACQSKGGILSSDDLADYRVIEREPIRFEYRGYTICSMPPPSSGGICLAEILNILEGFPLNYLEQGGGEACHLFASACEAAFADRSQWLGDPDFNPIPVEELVSQEYADRLRERIDRHHRNPVKGPGDPWNINPDRNTSHISVIDRDGNMCAITTSVNTSFGSLVFVPELGIFLNSTMDDFSKQAGAPNSFDLVGSNVNAVAPGKRPLSSMSPTLVFKDGKPSMCLGSVGGPKIITSVAQVIINVVDFGMNIQAAIDAPRVHMQWKPDILYVEAEIPPEVVRSLRLRGWNVEQKSLWSLSQGVSVDFGAGEFFGASDARGVGTAGPRLVR